MSYAVFSLYSDKTTLHIGIDSGRFVLHNGREWFKGSLHVFGIYDSQRQAEVRRLEIEKRLRTPLTRRNKAAIERNELLNKAEDLLRKIERSQIDIDKLIEGECK